MNVIIHHTEETNGGNIFFPSLKCWNPVTKIITIAAQVSKKYVSCRVLLKDLKAKFHVFKDNPMEIASEHRVEIENAARKLIGNNSYEEDGSIRIRYQDL